MGEVMSLYQSRPIPLRKPWCKLVAGYSWANATYYCYPHYIHGRLTTDQRKPVSFNTLKRSLEVSDKARFPVLNNVERANSSAEWLTIIKDIANNKS